jgi:hypothetical protein
MTHPYREAGERAADEAEQELANIARRGRVRGWLRWRGSLAVLLALGAPLSLWVAIGVSSLPPRASVRRTPVVQPCKREVVCGSCQEVGDFRAATLIRCLNPLDPPVRNGAWGCDVLDVPECR